MERILKNYKLLFLVLLILLFIVMTFSITLGSVSLKSEQVWKIVINNMMKKEIFLKDWKSNIEIIVWKLRVPRVITGVLAGASLSLIGILMQCLTKNPLASPYILGISAGASTGAVGVILFLGGSLLFISGGAFLMGTFTSILVFYLAGRNGEFSSTKLVLIGVAISSLFSGITTLMITLAPQGQKIQGALFWLAGSLAGSNWSYIPLMTISLILSVLVCFYYYKELNILTTGDEIASTMGVDIEKLRVIIVIISTLLTGIVVSNTGVIGFIGLVIPHITRGIVGGNHKKVIPIAVVLGGIFLLLTDIFTRVLFKSQEIPIGVITSIMGAPFFLQMLKNKNYKFGGK